MSPSFSFKPRSSLAGGVTGAVAPAVGMPVQFEMNTDECSFYSLDRRSPFGLFAVLVEVLVTGVCIE